MITVLLQGAPAQQGSIASLAITMGLMFLVFWLVVWRPQSQEQERHKRMIDNLKVGDEIVTSGGLLGKIIKVEEKLLTVELAKGLQVKLVRTSVQALQSEHSATASEAKVDIVPDKKS
jgi:preprotein translocase subunit YajC